MQNDASLEKSISRMEREMMALKTSHINGLGTIEFYSKSITIADTMSYVRVKITIVDGEPVPPFIACGLASGEAFAMPRTWTNNSVTVEFATGDGHMGEFYVISSSLIESVVRL